MNRGLCDLHTHSSVSDGTLTPTELSVSAKNIGLSAVALTDHNTVNGLSEFADACRKNGIIGICGCEFTTDYNGIELHLLGLFLPQRRFGEISEFVSDGIRRKRENTISLIETLRGIGLMISYEEISAKSRGELNRAHIASELCEKGYVRSVDEAFSRYLDERHGYYKPIRRVSVFDAINFVRSVGGAAILAHPLLDLDELELHTLLPPAIDAGLCGIETDYTKFSPSKRRLLREIADSYGICKSGGSDFHGSRKPDVQLGYGHGDLRVPIEYVLEMKEKFQLAIDI